MTKVFISYSRKDLDFVEKLASDLKDAGVDVWYDLSSLHGGDRWAAEIQSAIDYCEEFILVISPDSIESEWVFKEFLYASSNNKKVVPLLYKKYKLPLWLQDIHFIDIQGKKYQKSFHEILRAVGKKTQPTLELATSLRKPKFLKKEYIVALIGAIATIIAAIISAPFTEKWAATATPEPTKTEIIFPSATNTHLTSPTNTPVPTSTHTPTITPTLTPTATATFNPFANGFELISMDKIAYRGGTASAEIRTEPGTYCTLTFFLPSGTMSSTGGVGACTADEDGYCKWTWDVRSNVNPGYGNIVIIVDEQQESYPIKIE